jgi:hypothetical protein
MKKTVLYNTTQFKLVSYGFGWAFEFINKDTLESVFLQDESASTFYDELKDLQGYNPNLPISAVLSRLWFDYDVVAEPIEIIPASEWPLIISQAELIRA